jgi:ABC-2 type transport system permease protein
MKLLHSEIIKLVHQKRSYVGWGGLLAVPLLMSLAMYLERSNLQGVDPLIRFALHDGLLVPIGAIWLLTPLLLPMLAAMAGAYQLAGESETGTIKTWLMHSISRGGVLASKWGVGVIYLAIGLLLVFLGGLAGGGLAFGLHAPVLLSGETVSAAYGLWLILLAYLYVLAGAICVLSLALFFATLTNSSLTAAIAALVVFIVMNIIGTFSYFDFLQPYLFTSHLGDWQNLLGQPIFWHPIISGLACFALSSGGLMALAWYLFRGKDVLV